MPIVELTWLGFTAMVIIAVFFREKHYDLFYYSHYFAIVVLIAGIIHAWSFWLIGDVLIGKMS